MEKRLGVSPRKSIELATSPECAHAGFFGCLDAIERADVVRELLATAEEWISAKGRSAAQGPYLLSINGESGLLVGGHATPPMIMMPWHPQYLPGLLADAGYGRVQTLLALSLEVAKLDVPSWQRAIGRVRRSKELRLRGLRMRELASESELLRRLFNDAWSSNWGFAPLAESDIRAMRTGFRPFLNPDSGVVAERNGEPVGFMLVLPNLFDIITDLDGAPGLFGWPKFLFRVWRRQYQDCRVILMGISSQFRSTPIGAEIAIGMVSEVIRRVIANGTRSVEAGWILEEQHGGSPHPRNTRLSAMSRIRHLRKIAGGSPSGAHSGACAKWQMSRSRST